MGVLTPQLNIRDLLAGACSACLDTTVAVSMFGPEPCNPCLTSGRQFKPVVTKLADYVWRHAGKWKREDKEALTPARIFVHATETFPFTGPAVCSYLGVGARELKASVETIRSEWLLPLISRRSGGGGYWYAQDASQLREWFRTMRGQAVTELATAYGMVRNNHPELVGQEKLDFIVSFSDELKEALQ